MYRNEFYVVATSCISCGLNKKMIGPFPSYLAAQDAIEVWDHGLGTCAHEDVMCPVNDDHIDSLTVWESDV